MQRVAQTPVAVEAAAGADSSVLALISSADRKPLAAWPLLRDGGEGILSLKRRRPDAAHEHAYHSYWAGSIDEQHPFASDVRSLHTGRAYRGALIREHTRLCRWSREGSYEDEKGVAETGRPSGTPHVAMSEEGQLPLAMLIDGAWECRAGVLYQVKQKGGAVSKFDAKPMPGIEGPQMKRLTSVSSAMDELSMC